MRRSTAAVSIACLLLLFGAPAQADSKSEAKQHFSQGVRLVDQGQFEVGLGEFLEAYRLSPNYSVLYNIGQAYADLGRAAEATETLNRYLAEGGAQIPEARRAQVRTQLATLEGQTALLSIEVDVESTRLRLDDRELGTSPLRGPIRVDAGHHRLYASRGDQPPHEQELDIQPGAPLKVSLVLGASSVPTPTPTPTPTNTTPAYRPSPIVSGPPIEPTPQPVTSENGTGDLQRLAGVALAAVGLVGAGVGTYFTYRAHKKDEQSDENCGSNIGEPPGTCNDTGLRLNSEAIEASTAAIVSFAVGGGLLVSGVTLYLTAPSGAQGPAKGAIAVAGGRF
jgi:hypothetical protein